MFFQREMVHRTASYVAAVTLICTSIAAGVPSLGSPATERIQVTGQAGSESASEVVGVIPVRITTETSNVSITYQQEIVLDPAIYGDYLNSNLSNLLFAYTNGTPIYAWIQSNATNSSTQTPIWMSLAGEINRTLDIILYSKNISLLGQTSYLGEAPQLTPIYGQFDNGPRVFPFYDNFMGKSLNDLAWAWEGSDRNFTVNDGLTLGNNQWGGLLSNLNFDAADFSPGIYLNFSSSVYLNVAVGTDSHVRLVGGGNGQYLIADPYGNTNGSFVSPNGFGFFSFWTTSTTGHIQLDNQTLSVQYRAAVGPASAERISIRSDSSGWINVKYALLRQLPAEDSEYMPGVAISASPRSLSGAGLYPASFLETGLPRGAGWTLQLTNVATLTTTGTMITLAVANGSYEYAAISEDKSYSAGPAALHLIVAGGNVSTVVAFSFAFVLTFQAVGLPIGWLWTVRLSSSASSESYSPFLTIEVTNGTYSYSVLTSDPSCVAPGGSIVVAGPHAPVNVPFAAVNSTGNQSSTTYYILLLLGVAVLGIAWFVIQRMRPKPR